MEPLASKPLRAASVRPSRRQRKRQLHSTPRPAEPCCSDTESCASAAPPAQRPRLDAPRGDDAASARAGPLCAHDLCLYVRWHSAAGAVKVNRLPLDPIAGVDDLRGLFRRLIRGAFPPGALPDYLTSPAYYKFAPAEELISLPGDIARTEFRLVATLPGGWEYTVCERALPGPHDPQRRLLVTLAEYESEPVEVGGRRYVARLLAYPSISVDRAFLDEAMARLAAQHAAAEAPCECEASCKCEASCGAAAEAAEAAGSSAAAPAASCVSAAS